MVIKSIGYWFLDEDYTYIRIYGVTAPHILPKYVPNKLFLSKIAFQTMIVGFNSFLSKGVKKNLFIPYHFSIGYYTLIKYSQAKAEGNMMLEFIMPQGMKKNHDPLGLVPKHCALVGIQWPYIHQIVHEELRFQNVDSLIDVFPVSEPEFL
jgi:hypothetical protein